MLKREKTATHILHVFSRHLFGKNRTAMSVSQNNIVRFLNFVLKKQETKCYVSLVYALEKKDWWSCPSSSEYPDILVTMSLMAKMPKSGKEHYSVKYSQNVMKI